jgi:flagellar hook-associated protein 3 FlgL
MEGLQNQAATLKRLNAPSDNPVGAIKVLENRTDKINNDQFVTNAKIAETFLINTDTALDQLANLVVRAKEIALGQSSGASANDDTRMGIAEEVDHMYQQAIAIGNTRIGDRYLFGGYKTSTQPVNSEGLYQGDGGQIVVEIAKGVFLGTNVPGIDIFNTNAKNSNDYDRLEQNKADLKEKHPDYAERELASTGTQEGDKGENANVFNELSNLRIMLLTGDTEGIRETLNRFDDLHAKLISMRAKVGSRMKGLELTNQSIERHNITNASLSSSLEDADMAKVMTDMAREESVLKSSLSTSQKLIQPTLLDFLR